MRTVQSALGAFVAESDLTSRVFDFANAIAGTISAFTASGVTASTLSVQVSNATHAPDDIPETNWSFLSGMIVDAPLTAPLEIPAGIRYLRIVRTLPSGVSTRALVNRLEG